MSSKVHKLIWYPNSSTIKQKVLFMLMMMKKIRSLDSNEVCVTSNEKFGSG